MFKKSKLFALCFGLTLGLCADEFVILSQTDSPGWVFRPGEKITAAFRSGAPLDKMPVIECRDFYGNTKELKTTAGQGKNEFSFQLPTEDNGYFTLKSGETSCSYAVIKAAPEHDAFTNPFGANFHLNRIPAADVKRELAYAKYLGFDWARTPVSDWENLGSDNYDLELKRFEEHYEVVKNSGICLVNCIHFFPRFASGNPEAEYIVYSRTPTESMKEITKYAEYMSKRFPWITHWEIGNEPDATLFWLGRKSSMGNKDKMFRDFAEHLALASNGIKAGNPKAKVLYPGITGGNPRRFIEVTMENNSRKYCDIMNLHYTGSIELFRSIMKQYNQADAPFWITEIGGTSGGPVYEDTKQIRADLLQVIEQFACGAEKVFKYDFRNDGVNPADHEDNFGVITRDFHPKANAVANATMIRLLVNYKTCRRLNITHCCDDGYLKGFEFDNGKNEKVNFVILETAESAKVTLETSDAEVVLTDVMGNERTLTAKDGKITFDITRLPVFLTGRIIPKQGEVVYPEEKLMRTVPGNFINSGFDKDIAGWGIRLNKNIVKVSHRQENGNGFMHIEVSAPGPKGFDGVFTSMQDDVSKICKSLKKYEFIKVRYKVRLRYHNILGRGIASVANFIRPGEHVRFDRCDPGYENGSSDGWTTVEACQEISNQTGRIDFVLCFAPKTTGTVDLDNISLVLEIWRKPL